MTRFLTPRRLAILALAAVAPLAGCGKKITSVDAGYTQLEGVPNADARLHVWPDTPALVYYYEDAAPPGPSEEDALLGVEPVYRSGSGAVQTMLLDGTVASGFEFFRLAGNGGLQPLRDYVVNAPRKWLDSHWELYELTDSSPSSYSPSTYVARGLLAGTTTAASPLSNSARLMGTVSGALAYLGAAEPADSLFTMSWTPIAGAAGYWVHVYQFRSDALNDEYIASGTPAPVWNGKVRDTFVGYVAAPATSYRLGNPGAKVLTFRPPIFGQEYLVRVTAVDANGQVIAYNASDLTGLYWDVDNSVLAGARGGSYRIVQEDEVWKIFGLGATSVAPTRPVHASFAAAAPARKAGGTR